MTVKHMNSEVVLSGAAHSRCTGTRRRLVQRSGDNLDTRLMLVTTYTSGMPDTEQSGQAPTKATRSNRLTAWLSTSRRCIFSDGGGPERLRG